MPEATITVILARDNLSLLFLNNSSMAKTIPPKGVLKAADRPAAAPICNNNFRSWRENLLPIDDRILAPTWIVGPSVD